MILGFTKPLVACLFIAAVPVAMADETGLPETPCENAPSDLPTIALSDLLDSVARKSNKEFLVDSRVPAEVVIGQLDWHDVTYAVLHTILRNNELAAVTVQGKVNVIPVVAIRQYPLPILYEDDKTIADDEWVTRIMRPKRVNVGLMVPILRPLLPQQGHLSGVPQSNTLTIIGRNANVRRIVELVEDMDEHTPEPADDFATEESENEQRVDSRTQTVYLADVIRALPYFVNGHIQGFKVYPGSDREKFAALGLRPGDLITEIDDAAVTDQHQLEIFGSADQLSVTVERNGQSEVLVLETSLLRD